MKKFFAMAMAAAMIASMSAVSFAAIGTITTGSDSNGTVKVDGTKKYYPIVDAIGPFVYDADDKGLDSGIVEYGETAYFMLIEGHDDSKKANGDTIGDNPTPFLVTESETVSSLKVKASWEEGKNLVSSVSIVKKKVSNAKDSSSTPLKDSDGKEYSTMDTLLTKVSGLVDSYTVDKYYYFIAIATTSSTSTADADVIGTLTLSKSKHPKVDDLDMDIAVNIGWENNYNSDANNLGLNVTGDVGPLKAETYYAMKFNCDDEVDIEFNDESIFTVDVSGQSKVLFYYDTDFNSKIAAKYPLADLNFWNGNGAKFNRVGQMFLACKEDYAQFLYQVNADGTLSEVPGAEFDKYDEGFYFNTRVLGTYVISDMELELPSTTPSTPAVETPVVTTPVVTNPSTGAIA